MILKHEEIIAVLEKYELYSRGTHVIWATQHLTGTVNQYFIISFTEKGMVLMTVSPMGKLNEELLLLEDRDLLSYQFKKGLFAYKLLIETQEDVYTFTVNPFMIGSKWHKEELAAILEQNYFNKRQ